MHIAICKFTLRIHASQSLKSKRRVIKSLCDRLRNRFNISVAEVDHLNEWQLSGIGCACLNTDHAHLQASVAKIVEFVRQSEGDYEILDVQQEILAGF